MKEINSLLSLLCNPAWSLCDEFVSRHSAWTVQDLLRIMLASSSQVTDTLDQYHQRPTLHVVKYTTASREKNKTAKCT